VVAAFDNQREFERCLQAVSADIHRRRTAGEPIDDQRAANRRLATRAIRHGVSPGSRVERLAMPSNIAILRMEHGRSRWRPRVRRLFPPLRRRADQP
jgi:hypothetical protein